MRKTETFTLPAGTICKRNGIPFELAEDTKILCHPANIGRVTENADDAEYVGPWLSEECRGWRTATAP